MTGDATRTALIGCATAGVTDHERGLGAAAVMEMAAELARLRALTAEVEAVRAMSTEHPELFPDDDQTTVKVNLSRDGVRALEGLSGEYGFSRTWVINLALVHLEACREGRAFLTRLTRE